MSQHSTKHSIIFSVIFASLAMIITLAGCKDGFIYRAEEIPDAEVEVLGEVIFKPLVPMDVQTRAEAPEGGEYKGIRSLYVFFFDADGDIVDEYSGEVKDFTTVSSDGSHGHVKFTKKIRAGQYYVFAVANIPEDENQAPEEQAGRMSALREARTITDLKNFKLVWDDKIENDLEMFGIFTLDEDKKVLPSEDENVTDTIDNETFEGDVLLSITPSQKKLHSWVRRAASKVTIDFNGANLKEGVTVYIKKATLKDVPSGAYLGGNSAVGESGFTCRQSEYSISYNEKDENGISVTKGRNPSLSDAWNNVSDLTGFHDDAARALPCYENMQGEHEDKSKLQDSDGDGIIDSFEKDGVNGGTYLEVEGHYVSERPEYKSEGDITYRFMLGKNALNDFDLIRNHHYKITMNFRGYGNDIDWHIVYKNQYLDATKPEDVDYRGEFFTPVSDIWEPANAGNDFSTQNTITVTSYASDDKTIDWQTPTITYTYFTHNDDTGEWIEGETLNETDNAAKGWLSGTAAEETINKGTQKVYTFIAKTSLPKNKTVNALFSQTEVSPSPYNLSNPNGDMDIKETANSYIVNAPGWYCFPLVYGNGVANGNENTEAYNSEHFVNHLGNPIKGYKDANGVEHKGGAYIKNHFTLGETNRFSAVLIWQDALLIQQDEQDVNSLVFDPSLFGGIGGIKFHIPTIAEGNAVIALIDNNAGNNDTYVEGTNTKAVWSWHIWATRFGSSDFEKNITLRGHDGTEYDVMPVHLGWCAGDNPVIYYPRRKCEIKFTVGKNEIVRTIEQYPHFALPRGDHPYYQWGRKDPFVGTNTPWGNKPRWVSGKTEAYGTGSDNNPPRLYNEPITAKADRRRATKDCLNELIKNPDKWHNAPRTAVAGTDEYNPEAFYSANEVYEDLWSIDGQKTIYDPCPPGYQVGSEEVFSGFTVSGNNEVVGVNWYDVLENKMYEYSYSDGGVNANVLEFYTDTRKIQTITFPVTGYRDYDKSAGVYEYPNPGGNYNGVGYVWTNHAHTGVGTHPHKSAYEKADKTSTIEYTANVNNGACACHLKFQRKDLGSGEKWEERGFLIAPREDFYNTDGFAVRPVRIK